MCNISNVHNFFHCPHGMTWHTLQHISCAVIESGTYEELQLMGTLDIFLLTIAGVFHFFTLSG